MILDIAIGIVLAYIFIRSGPVAAWLMVIAAAFYFGFGGPLIAFAVIGGALLGFGWLCAVGVPWAWRKLTRPRARELEWSERKEPKLN